MISNNLSNNLSITRNFNLINNFNYKTRVREGRANLYHRFDQGIPIAILISEYSALIDEILREIWSIQLEDSQAAALIAVGGYGRAELLPASDIDLLILLDAKVINSISIAIENLMIKFWDLGLEIGHSVRTLDECVHIAQQDVTVMTNLLESRYLCGSKLLFQHMRAATAPGVLWDSQCFFAAKLTEQHARWHKYGCTAYNLEPNIKENPGGLRDLQMIGWITKWHFTAASLKDLINHGFLTENEYQILIDGQILLWRIRFALHRMTGRQENRLLFEYQRTLADQFGFYDGEHDLAVEQFMQQYYRTVHELNCLNEMLLQLFQEAILFHDQPGPPIIINNRFQARNGYLEVRNPNIFRRSPLALLEIFHLLQINYELIGIRASTIRLIRENRYRINDSVRTDLRARSLFMEMLREQNGITHALRRMNRYGILAEYLPVFRNIIGRMQYDLFHVYTVDQHTLTVIRNLRKFLITKHDHEYPLCSAIAKRIPKRELLYLAGLFHDIAKGRGGDHSNLGARDAWEFCRLHGLSEFDSRLVAWLVEQHLVMSMTAQRKDISDPEVIQNFAARIGDVTRLDYLYLLTVADASATNPERWNRWLDALLRDLYHRTRDALLRGLENPQAQDELVTQKQVEARRLVKQYGSDPAACNLLWITFNLDYFLQNSPDEIAWQTHQILTNAGSQQPFVVIRPHTERGGTEIFLYTNDQVGLFARTTAVLEQLGLSILDARVMTTDGGMAVDSYQVLDLYGKIIDDPHRLTEIQNSLINQLKTEQEVNFKGARPISRRHRQFPITTQVSFARDEPNQRTIMWLTTLDRPGLLAEIGDIFQTCGIRLQSAKIATIGAEVEDVFFITNENATPILCETVLTCLRREIHARLEGSSSIS